MAHNPAELSVENLSRSNSSEQNPASSRNELERRKNFWSLASLTFVLLAPFASILLSPRGRVLGDSLCDGPSAYYFFGYFAGQCWHDGIVPLWNPYIMLGIPFLGEGQASVFHPLSFLFVFLKPSLAVNWLIAAAFVLTGLFFYGYLRALQLGRAGSWAGAVTWSFSSAMISRIFAGHLNILLTYLSMPMILMFWERYRARGGTRYLVGVALGYAMAIWAFYPQALYIFSLFFLLYVLIQSAVAVIDGASTMQREGKAILALGIFILLGTCAGAVQLLPALDFVSQSFRQEATLEFCGTFSFAPENFLTLIAPRFFGSTLEDMTTRYWGRNTFWEMWIYLGVLPLLMSVAGAWRAPRRLRLALLGCGAVFLVLGLGKHTFLFPAFYKYLPFFDIFRGSSKNTVITLFCLVTLSAYGFEGLFAESAELKPRLRRITAIATVIMLACCIAVGFLLLHKPEASNSNWKQFVRAIWTSGELCTQPTTTNVHEVLRATSHGAKAALGRATVLVCLSAAVVFFHLPERWRKHAFLLPFALILFDLLGVFIPLLRTFDKSIVQKPLSLNESARTPYPPRILVLANQMPNIAMWSGFSSAFGYTGNTLTRYNHFINHLQHLNPKEGRNESTLVKLTPQFSMLAFDAVALNREDVTDRATPIGTLGDKVILPFEALMPFDQPRRARNRFERTERPHAFLAAAPKYFSKAEEALSYVLSSHAHVWTKPAIERADDQLEAHPLDNDESVRFIAYEPNKVILEARANRKRELVLCGMFEKNWTATVNGVAASVEPANYVFRAVQVPQGKSRVVFEYKPKAFYIGAVASGVSLLVLAAIFVVAAIQPNRSSASNQAD